MENEKVEGCFTKLLKPAMKDGKILDSYNLDINEARNNCKSSLEKLLPEYKKFDSPLNYRVEISEKLKNKVKELHQSRVSLV